jgi:hypothetical protein
MFCSPGGRRVPFSCFPRTDSSFAVLGASGPVFMFCPPELVFDYTDGVGSRLHVLRSRTHFRQYRVRQVPFSCFTRPDSYSAVRWASGPVFIFCAPRLVFGNTEGARTGFHRFRVRRVPFSYFARSNSFSPVSSASDPYFMFCSPVLVRRYRGRWVRLSCFALPDSFLAVPKASGPVLMYCGSGLVLFGTEGMGSRFHVLRA